MDLDRNPSYHEKIKNLIQVKASVDLPDTMNLQDEFPTIIFGPHIDDHVDDKEEVVAPF